MSLPIDMYNHCYGLLKNIESEISVAATPDMVDEQQNLVALRANDIIRRTTKQRTTDIEQPNERTGINIKPIVSANGIIRRTTKQQTIDIEQPNELTGINIKPTVNIRRSSKY